VGDETGASSVGLSPTALQVVEHTLAAMRTDKKIPNDVVSRFETLLKKGIVPKAETINPIRSAFAKMIRIKSVHIEEFRGIRELDLELDCNNFAICGPNGTGKSGIVDAIEFCLTGDVTRLSGHGTTGISVKNHAPHVDQSEHPEMAKVTITADIPSIGKIVTIHRSVKNPQLMTTSPASPDVTTVVEELLNHPARKKQMVSETISHGPRRYHPARAVQAWQILLSSAMNRQTITYKTLGRMMYGRDAAGVLDKILGHIAYYCNDNKLPPFTSIVVGKKRGTPGKDIPINFRKLNQERERVYATDWYDIYPPNARELHGSYINNI
jgi:hypothetical protein